MFNLLAQSTLVISENPNSTSSLSDGASATIVVLMLLLVAALLAVIVLTYVGLWKLLEKAGRHGWSALVPYHNVVQVLEVAGKPGWWVLLFMGAGVLMAIPLLNLILAVPVLIALIVFNFIVHIALAKSFGKSDGFGVMMTFFPFVGYPMLGLSKDTKYVGRASTSSQSQ